MVHDCLTIMLRMWWCASANALIIVQHGDDADPAALCSQYCTPSPEGWFSRANFGTSNTPILPPKVYPTMFSVSQCWFSEHTDTSEHPHQTGCIIRGQHNARPKSSTQHTQETPGWTFFCFQSKSVSVSYSLQLVLFTDQYIWLLVDHRFFKNATNPTATELMHIWCDDNRFLSNLNEAKQTIICICVVYTVSVSNSSLANRKLGYNEQPDSPMLVLLTSIDCKLIFYRFVFYGLVSETFQLSIKQWFGGSNSAGGNLV